MKVKVESEKVGLKLNIQKMKIMASGPITSWEIDGETVETVADFIFLGSKITTDGCYYFLEPFWAQSFTPFSVLSQFSALFSCLIELIALFFPKWFRMLLQYSKPPQDNSSFIT